MPAFWLSILAMLGAALFVVLRPLFRRSTERNVDANAAKVDVYRNRLEEMEAEVASGVMSGADAEAAHTELARALVQETDTVSDAVVDRQDHKPHHWWLAGVIAVLVPFIAVSLYLWLGTPDLINSRAPVHGGGAGDVAHTASIEAMVKRLAGRLEQNPDDPEGWMMLVNSYMTLGRHADALKAIERLYQITGDQPLVLVRYADILATVKGGDLSGQPSELIQKALKLDPENAMGLWLAGMAAAQSGDPGFAIDYWQRLLPLIATDQASQKEVSDLIAQARGQMGAGAETPLSEPRPVTGAIDAVEAVKGTLAVRVEVAPGLNHELKPDDALFIVAKGVNGPPMPVAVIRKTAADLPLEITMDDNNSMMPSMKLTAFAQLELSARISQSGNALPQSGDLVSSPVIVTPGQDDPVTLLIGRQLP